MPNKKPPTSREMSTKDYLTSILTTIDEIESKTGIDFCHKLPDDIENELESTIPNKQIIEQLLQ